MIQLSQAATKEILRLKSKQSTRDAKFRLSIASTGCLSRSYVMTFDASTQSSDQIITFHDELQIVVNPADLPYLNGLAIDYSEDMMGGGFRFQNPNATQVCGCGNSFAI